MSLFPVSKKRTYLLKSVIGFILISLFAYSVYSTEENITKFLRIIMFLIITGYTINYIVLYVKTNK